MKLFDIEFNETTKHYMLIFGYFSLLVGVIFLTVQLSMHSEWFAKIWEYRINRIIILLVMPLLLFILLIYLYSRFFGELKQIRAFQDTNLQNLEDCEDGQLVRFQGEVMPFKPIKIAPLSQRECVAFTLRTFLEVERATVSGSGYARSESAWETLKYMDCINDFVLKCGQHYALVRTNKAKIIIQPDRVHDTDAYGYKKNGVIDEAESELRKRVLQFQSVNSRRFLGVYAQNIKIEEGILGLNEQVAILGTGSWIDITSMDELGFLVEAGHTQVFEVNTTEEYILCISDSTDILEQTT